MKEIVLKAVIGVLVTATWGFCVAAVKKAHKRQKELDERQQAIEEGLKSLLRAEIISTYDKTRECGYCPIYSKDALTSAFHSYTGLNGNGTMPGLYEFVMAAPTSPPNQP